MWFGAGNLNATVARHLFPGYDTTAPSTEINVVAPRDGVLRNLHVRHNATPGSGVNVLYEVKINSVATALTATLADNANGPATDTTTSVAVQQGDLISVIATPQGTITVGVIVVASFEFLYS